MNKYLIYLYILLLLVTLSTVGAQQQPITEENFDQLIAGQHAAFQLFLKSLFSEINGFIVTGPLTTTSDGPIDMSAIRILTSPDNVTNALSGSALTSLCPKLCIADSSAMLNLCISSNFASSVLDDTTC